MKESRKQLKVIYKGKQVGTLAQARNRSIAFEYSDEWIEQGFSISPIYLPLEKKVFIPKKDSFCGLFGVFADSLPDAWGRLLLDRTLQANAIDPQELNQLDRLAIVGSNGMGGLEYVPEYELNIHGTSKTLDELSTECTHILENADADLDTIFRLGGSSGGSRPKAYVNMDEKEWIVKFPLSTEGENQGLREYEYSVLAKSKGINMTETKLCPSEICDGYFATVRFDRPKVHMLSAAAALEVDFERSLTDYSELFKLTNYMTNGRKADIEQLYRVMCFNVIYGNQDDHLKNFTFIHDDERDTWKLSPAYDLTKITTGYGEHTTTVNGKGRYITEEDVITVGKGAGLSSKRCAVIWEEIKD